MLFSPKHFSRPSDQETIKKTLEITPNVDLLIPRKVILVLSVKNI